MLVVQMALWPDLEEATVPVAVLTTGGTIASGRSCDGRISPLARGAISHLIGPDVLVRDVMAIDSSTMSLQRMTTLRNAVAEVLDDPDTDAVVILHGTDTLEETAMFLDLFHDDPRPVVVTGAQRPADHPDPDGPHNISFAIQAARSADSREQGVLIAFGGQLLAARGVRKAHTTQLDAYRKYVPATQRPAALPWHPTIGQQRVDIVALYPGADRTHIDASVSAGARGIILDAMGSGNANPNILGAVSDCILRGVAVVVTSRVPDGVVEPVYGGSGGGHDLIAAGAIACPWLRAAQARIQLAALLACGAERDQMVDAFAEACDPVAPR